MAIQTPLEFALASIGKGWPVFPVHSIKDGVCTCGSNVCKSPGKHPMASLVPQGLHDATTDASTVERWFRWSSANLGKVTGKISGLVVIDIDIRPPTKHGDETLDALEQKYGRLPPTAEVLTGSKSRHLYFTYPEGVTIQGGTDKLGKWIDVQSDGRYVVAPPSTHLLGPYCWEPDCDPFEGAEIYPLPQWMIDLLTATHQQEIVAPALAVTLTHDRVQELRSALTVIPPDDRDNWFKNGAALAALSPGEQTYGLWTEWSQTSEKYDPQDQLKTWRGFKDKTNGVTIATLFGLAKQYGWHEPAPIEVQTAPAPQKSFPSEFLDPPGALGEIASYLTSISIRPQPVFSLLAALSLGGLIMGRRYETETGLRTNQYIVAAGATGSGKDGPRQGVRRILEACNLSDFIGGEPASGQALLTRTAQQPNIMFQQDEFGDFLASITGNRASQHKADIATNLIKLFSSTDTLYHGTEYAKQDGAGGRPRIDIDRPCVHIYGTTVPESLFDAFQSRHVVNGLLNRMLIAETPLRRPKMQKPNRGNPPDSILNWITEVSQGKGESELEGISAATPITIHDSPESEAVFMKLQDTIDAEMARVFGSGLDALWDRAWEHAAKISAILALSENPQTRIVRGRHAEWAIGLVTHIVRAMTRMVEGLVSDNATEAAVKRVATHIRESGKSGIVRHALTRKNQRIPAKERADILDTLVESGQIRATQEGRTVTYFWIA